MKAIITIITPMFIMVCRTDDTVRICGSPCDLAVSFLLGLWTHTDMEASPQLPDDAVTIVLIPPFSLVYMTPISGYIIISIMGYYAQ